MFNATEIEIAQSFLSTEFVGGWIAFMLLSLVISE